MLEFFIKRPVTTIMFVLFFVVMGLVSFPKMNVERMPPIDLPMVTTTLVYPGAAQSEIETQVVKPVEDSISKVSGIKKITSQIYDGFAYIITEFNLGEDALEKQQEIKGMVDSIALSLPTDLEAPVVKKLNIMQQNVMDIAITGAPDLRTAYDFVDKTLSQKITAVPGVADVEVFGGLERSIRVFLDPERMTSKAVSINDVIKAINDHNINVPSGKVETKFSANSIRFIGEFATVDAVKNMRIITEEGGIFRLADIANVEDSYSDRETNGRFNKQDVIIISIVKATDGNAVKISDALHKRLDMYRDMVKTGLKSDAANIEVIYDSAISIKHDTNGTLDEVAIGVLLTVIVLLFFTRNWRSTIIAGVVIPVSLVSGFLLMNNAGFSINRMTLLAISAVLGILVSNAIILIESALGLMRQGMSPEKAAVEGTKKVAVAVLAGTSTHMVVFLPLAFMAGIAGLFMKQFGMTVVYLTALSLMFSFTLTPMMIAKLLKNKKLKAEKPKKEKGGLDWFRGIFDSQIHHPFRWLILAIVIFIGSSKVMKYVGSEFSPSADTNEINITARGPVGSTFEKTLKLAETIEDKLSEFPEVQKVSVKMGRRGIQNIGVNITLIPKEQRVSDKIIAQRIVESFADIPDAEFQVKAGEISGGNSASDMIINVMGDDNSIREKISDQLIDAINKMPEVQSAVLAAQKSNNEIQFIPNEHKMNEFGVNNATVGLALRTAFYGTDDLKYRENGEEYPLSVEFSKSYKTADSFSDIMVNTKRGMTPITELGDLEYQPASRDIYRINKVRETEINVNLGKSTIGPVRAQIDAEIAKMTIPDGYKVVYGGMSEMQDETSTEMGKTFMLATILTFILLAAVMNSIAHPFVIATSILTSFAGVFIFLFLGGGTMNISTMLSIIMLVGLVVNNNILLLEGAVNAIAKGADPVKSLWHEFTDKYRMILMTTIAVACGMIPQLLSDETSKVSMGAVLVGGMAGSLFWTFFLTPALFILIERLKRKILRTK